MAADGAVLSTREAATRLPYARQALELLCERGQLAGAFRSRRTWFIPVEEVERLARGETGGVAHTSSPGVPPHA